MLQWVEAPTLIPSHMISNAYENADTGLRKKSP